MSGKRQAGVQINKDDYDPDAQGEAEPTGTWQKADDSVLAQRKIRKAKRPTAGGGGGGGFGAAAAGGIAAPEPPDAAKANPFASVALVAPPASAASAFGASTTFGAGAASKTFGATPSAFGSVFRSLLSRSLPVAVS